MKKTKEIKVVLHKVGQHTYRLHNDMFSIENAPEIIEGKLIIEIPEKKIEITESQFDEAMKRADLSSCLVSDCDKHSLKKELGF